MDAHIFRRLCDALIPLLTGARLEKIQAPAPNVFMFTLFIKKAGMAGRKQYLYLQSGRKQPYLFLSAEKASAGGQPSSSIMRLRKYVGGHRVAACVADWTGRKLALLCGTVQEAGQYYGQECWLVLDLREGASLWMGFACGLGTAQNKNAAPQPCAPASPSPKLHLAPAREPERGVATKARDASCPAFELGAYAQSQERHALEAFYRGEGEGGAAIVGALDPAVPFAPPCVRWPVPEALDAACADWRAWAVLTPALRRTLPQLDPLDRAALLADLAYGGGDLFCYSAPDAAGECDSAAQPALISAWPLPPALRGGRQEIMREDVIAAFAEYAAPQVLGSLTHASRAQAAAPLEKEVARLNRILEKQEAEEARLHALCAQAVQGRALQAVLWRYDAESKLPELPIAQEVFVQAQAAVAGCAPLPVAQDANALPHSATKPLPQPAANYAGNTVCKPDNVKRTDVQPQPSDTASPQPTAADVPSALYMLTLNPRLTLRENMAAFFNQAKRGKRGLSFVAQRRQEIMLARDAALQAAAQARMGLTPALVPRKVNAPQAGLSLARALPKGVQGFLSSDGFAIMRGRDVKGNLAALRMAGAHDIWLHVGGGAGSHAIIRRSYAGQVIPDRTLDEAGALVACKSWQRDNDRAEIIYAEARHIKPMKNAGAGKVRIEKVLTTRIVALQAGIEEKLALPSA